MSASKPFLASFDGECAECGGDIEAGYDRIAMLDGEAVHVDCVPDDDDDTLTTFPL